MNRRTADNERIKRDYFEWLGEANRKSDATIDAVAKAIARYEKFTGYKNFKDFHRNDAKEFKRFLANQVAVRSGRPLSLSTRLTTLNALRSFFSWLSFKPGYKSRLDTSDTEYFNMTANEARIANAYSEARVPTLEQIYHVLKNMPTRNDLDLRNRTLVAWTILSGMRDRAIASLKIRHIDLIENVVYQDAREVRTKNAKSMTTSFFPVDDVCLRIVTEWIEHLRVEMLWGLDDPVFPATRVAQGNDRNFRAAGLTRSCWRTAGPIRKIFKSAFEGAGLPYFNPHSFRHTLARLGGQCCHSPEAYKAWSQNMGHESVLTTLSSYGHVSSDRQKEVMRSFRSKQKSGNGSRRK